MRHFLILSVAATILLATLSGRVSAEENKVVKSLPSITGILTEVTQDSITIRTPDGKEASYMRGLKLKIPEKAGKGSLVTIRINPILNVVKSIELGIGKRND